MSTAGTDKTLSIICSALQWPLDHRDAAATALALPNGATGPGGDDDEPGWLWDFTPLPPVRESTKKKANPPTLRKPVVLQKPDGFGEEDGDDDKREFLLVGYRY